MRLFIIGKAKICSVQKLCNTENVGFSSHRIINGKKTKTHSENCSTHSENYQIKCDYVI